MVENEVLSEESSKQPIANTVPQLQEVINVEQRVQQALMQSRNDYLNMFRQEIKDLVKHTVEETLNERIKGCTDTSARSMPNLSRPPPSQSRMQYNMTAPIVVQKRNPNRRT